MKNLIVCILGYRMVPNIQFIKEMRTAETDFLFICDPEVEEEGIREDIKKVFHIDKNELPPIIVDEYSAEELENELRKRDFEEYGKIRLNVSEGTAILINATAEFFRDYAADIFYLPDTTEYMEQIFPKRKRGKVEIRNKINLNEYLTAHGLEMRGGRLSNIPMEYIQEYLVLYLENEVFDWQVLSKLRKYRSKRERYKISMFPYLDDFLHKINFPLSDVEQIYIHRSEIGFLTGDWFEEFVYYRIKDEFNLSDDNIKTGITVIKDGVRNEFDVMFFYNGILYTIECKTSVKNNEEDIMTDTIYKVKALQDNLGYYSDSNIFTLSSRESGEVKDLHIERGEVFDIDVYCREDILNCDDISKMLKIRKCKSSKNDIYK